MMNRWVVFLLSSSLASFVSAQTPTASPGVYIPPTVSTNPALVNLCQYEKFSGECIPMTECSSGRKIAPVPSLCPKDKDPVRCCYTPPPASQSCAGWTCTQQYWTQRPAADLERCSRTSLFNPCSDELCCKPPVVGADGTVVGAEPEPAKKFPVYAIVLLSVGGCLLCLVLLIVINWHHKKNKEHLQSKFAVIDRHQEAFDDEMAKYPTHDDDGNYIPTPLRKAVWVKQEKANITR